MSPIPANDETSLRHLRDGTCPKCHGATLIAGPWGGASRNIFCESCLTRWNAHAVNYGIIACDDEGPCAVEDIEHAKRTYGYSFWRGVGHDPGAERSP